MILDDLETVSLNEKRTPDMQNKTQKSKIPLLMGSFHLVNFEIQRNYFLNEYFMSRYGLNSVGTDRLLRTFRMNFCCVGLHLSILIFSNTAH